MVRLKLRRPTKQIRARGISTNVILLNRPAPQERSRRLLSLLMEGMEKIVASQKEIAALKDALHKELDRIRRDHDPLKIDNAFVLWFADAYILAIEIRPSRALSGGLGTRPWTRFM